MLVCIDPGHGGSDPGAIAHRPEYTEEKDINLAISLLLAREINNLQENCLLTRSVDRTMSTTERAFVANGAGADLFVSVHCNAAATDAARGYEVWHFPSSWQGESYALGVITSMMAAFPTRVNRGVKEANFAVLRKTSMPAIIVECDFMTTPEELVFLRESGNQRNIAFAIAQGIVGSYYYGRTDSTS